MIESLTPLPGWESFYVIVGSSAAALTGLQFVVIALVADVRFRTASQETTAAFATPTVVHFSAALLISAILSAPWSAMTAPAVALGLCGAVGTVYSSVILIRARRQTGYKPVLEDWVWHVTFPFLAYGGIFIAAALLPRTPIHMLFVIGAATLLLVFIGIHNAWDTVTFVVADRLNSTASEKNEAG